MLHQDLFLLFVLAIILSAFVGMSIVLRILRSIPFMGFGYSAPGVAAHGERSESSGGTGFLTFLVLLIIVAGIFWLLFTQSQKEHEPKHSSFQIEQESRYLPKEEVPPVDGEEVIYQSSTNDNPNGEMVNRTPSSPVGTPLHYGIQVAAFRDHSSATRKIGDMNGQYNVRIHFDEDELYKVIITGFTSEQEAKHFKRKQKIKGFVRAVDGTYTPTKNI